MKNQRPDLNPLRQRAVALLLVMLAAGPLSAQEAEQSFELQPGMVVDRTVDRIYTMDERGGITALDMDTGKLVWHTEEAQKPLHVAEGLLIAQADPDEEENAMRIVALDKKSGALLFANSQPVPEGVRPAVTETLDGNFFTAVSAEDADAIVRWRFVERPLGGLPPQKRRSGLPRRAAAVAAAEDDQEEDESGAFRLNLSSGAMSVIDPAMLPKLPPPQAPGVRMATEKFRIAADFGGPQFLSADGQHIMVSDRRNGQRFNRYLLAIFDRDATPLGELPSATSVVPFFVSDSQIIFTAGPSVRREGGKLVAEGLQLRSADLKTGKPIWSRPIRDTKYRGPLPP